MLDYNEPTFFKHYKKRSPKKCFPEKKKKNGNLKMIHL